MKLTPRICFCIGLLFSLFALASCNNDEDYAPNYEQEFVDLETDHQGYAQTLIRDNGEHLAVINPPTGLRPDSCYRFVSVFIREKNGVRLTSYLAIRASEPVVPTQPLTSDGVKVQSIWRGSNYINMVLNILCKDKAHKFGFIDNGIMTTSAGTRILQLALIHDANKDEEAFTRNAYLCCSLLPYSDKLQIGRDSIYFEMKLYNGSKVVYPLPF